MFILLVLKLPGCRVVMFCCLICCTTDIRVWCNVLTPGGYILPRQESTLLVGYQGKMVQSLHGYLIPQTHTCFYLLARNCNCPYILYECCICIDHAIKYINCEVSVKSVAEQLFFVFWSSFEFRDREKERT